MPFSTIAAAIRAQDSAARNAMFAMLTNTGRELRGKHRSVVARWKNKPRFTMATERRPTYMSVTVIPAGEHEDIWGYVEKGTRPHFIRPRVAGTFLRFKTAYHARTAAVARYNVGDGKAHGKWVRAQLVAHPGNKARKFGITFLAGLRPSLAVRTSQAIRLGLSRVR